MTEEVKRHWAAEYNENYEPSYIIRYHPVPGGTKNDDGSTTLTLSFPVLQATQWIENPDAVVQQIAHKLNSNDELFGALETLLKLNDDSGPFGGDLYQDRVDRAWENARAVIAKARGETHA